MKCQVPPIPTNWRLISESPAFRRNLCDKKKRYSVKAQLPKRDKKNEFVKKAQLSEHKLVILKKAQFPQRDKLV